MRNEDYWREGANVDLIEINAITDKVARTSALITGDIDMMMSLDPKAIKQIESADGVRVWSVSTGAYMGICCMLNQAPGNNRDFVLAMKYIQRR
ncbi:MAG: ABC transporter substrate-binding protein, partial [Pseudomonadales bacterium]